MAAEENETEELELEEEGGSEQPESPPEVPQDPNEPITVQTDDSKRQARRERRAERQNQFKQLQEEVARLRAERQAPPPQQYYQQPPQPQVNPVQARLNQITERTKSLRNEYEAMHQAGRMTPELEEKYQQQAVELRRAEMAVISQAAAPQINEQELIQKAAWHRFRAENQDIFSNGKAEQWAWAKYYQNIAEGQQDTMEMVNRVLKETRARFGLGGSPAPDQATRQRLSGVSARGSGQVTQSSGEIVMGPHEKRMAKIAFSGKLGKDGKPLTEAQIYQHWANTVGKKLATEQIKTK